MQDNINKLSPKTTQKQFNIFTLAYGLGWGKFFERAPFPIISSPIQAGNTTGKGDGKKTWHLIINFDKISL